MKKFIVFITCALLSAGGYAQEANRPKPGGSVGDGGSLPNLQTCVHIAQQNLLLFTEGQPNDVNSIIKDIEQYIDSMPKNKTTADQLLAKHFAPMRHFFLTTSNRTSVAAEFLYRVAPFNFCRYKDTALALNIWAVKDGEPYNLSKMTDKRIARLALTNCLLPSLAALDEFKDNDIKYIALSVYYGAKDSREGAPHSNTAPYCLTLVARLSDIQQYTDGLITDKGLLAVADIYLADEESERQVKLEN